VGEEEFHVREEGEGAEAEVGEQGEEQIVPK